MSVPNGSLAQWQDAMEVLAQGWRGHDFNVNIGGMHIYQGWFFPYGAGVYLYPPEYLGNGYWKVTWRSNLFPPATFWLWLNGELIGTTSAYEYVVAVPVDGQAEFFVFDNADERPPRFYPNRLDVYWPGATGAVQYRVEQFVGAEWVKIGARVLVNGNNVSFEFESPKLDNEASHQFRVIAVAENENETTVLDKTALMVRRPDRRAFNYIYDDATRVITVDED